MAAFAFPERTDIDALMNDLPGDGGPEPDSVSGDEDEEGEDAIVGRGTDGLVVPMEEELDVAKRLCIAAFLPGKELTP